MNVLGDGIGFLKLVAATTIMDGSDYPTDFMPAKAARVSVKGVQAQEHDPDKDYKLMRTLGTHKPPHSSPFEHVSVTVCVKAPIFVAREWMRHRTQAYSEISARYTSSFVGEYYIPQEFRRQAVKNKQASEGGFSDEANSHIHMEMEGFYEGATADYQELIRMGVARELARLVMPVGQYTQFYATASLLNWARFHALRNHPDAQWEIQQYAKGLNSILVDLYPNSWSIIRDGLSMSETEDMV